MKKIYFYLFVFSLLLVACGKNSETTTTTMVATEVVPQAATEVIPCAAPGPDSGGKVATEVVPAE